MRSRKFKKLLLDKKGFTLGELIATVAVFGILAAIAVPNYLALQPGQRLNGGAREVLSKLSWARAQAVAGSTTYAVTFPDNKTLRIFNDLNGNDSPDTGEWTQEINIEVDYPGVTLSASGSTPKFNGRGTASGNTTITISNSSGSKQVEVKPSGHVKIIEP